MAMNIGNPMTAANRGVKARWEVPETLPLTGQCKVKINLEVDHPKCAGQCASMPELVQHRECSDVDLSEHTTQDEDALHQQTGSPPRPIESKILGPSEV